MTEEARPSFATTLVADCDTTRPAGCDPSECTATLLNTRDTRRCAASESDATRRCAVVGGGGDAPRLAAAVISDCGATRRCAVVGGGGDAPRLAAVGGGGDANRSMVLPAAGCATPGPGCGAAAVRSRGGPVRVPFRLCCVAALVGSQVAAETTTEVAAL
jgi:hypothetical protein